MPRTLRHFARLPHLRVMAWLAWLMLAMVPVHAAPGGMVGMAPEIDHGVHLAQASDHAHHAMPTPTDCCSGQDHAGHGTTSACHRAATCGTALTVMAMAGLFPVVPVVMHIPPSPVVAPKLMHAPPLRPPLVVLSRLT